LTSVQNPSETAAESSVVGGEADAPAQHRQRLFSGLRIVSLCTLLSRVLGLIRDMGMAALFGLSPIADHFVVAFSIPNLARRLFGEGALSASFLPVLTRELQKPDRENVWRLVSAVFALLTVSLTALVLVGELGIWGLLKWGSGDTDIHILLGLTAAMLPYLILICLAAQVSAVLHVLGHFTLPALVPVMLNLFWIATLWLIAPFFAPDALSQAYAIAAAIVVAGSVQVAMQWPLLKKYGYHFRTDWSSAMPRVREIAWATLPVMLGMSTTLINTLADRLIAWGFARFLENPPLQEGAAAALYYAQRLYQFPLGVFGVALGTVLFPLLARHAAQQRYDLLRHDLTLGLRLVVAVGFPASVGLVLLARPLATTLFEYGEFDAGDSARTAGLIAAYGCGVWAYCGQLILYRAYYALDDRTTPLRVGLASVAVNLALNLTLIWPLGGEGLAYATTISATLQVIVLTWMIQSRAGQVDGRRLWETVFKSGIATAVMSAACFVAMWVCGEAQGIPSRVLSVVIPVAVSVIVYYAAATLLGMNELKMLLRRKVDEEH